MTASLNVVILVGGAAGAEQLLRSSFGDCSPATALSAAASRQVDVSLVSRGAIASTPGIKTVHVIRMERVPLMDRITSTLRMDALEKVLRRSPIGRLLLSLGPTDPSRVLWRAVKADQGAMTLLSSADIVLAADLAAVRTAWNLVQLGRVSNSYFGLQSAEKIFAARFRE